MELDTSKITNMSAVEFTPLPSKLWGQGGTGAVPRGASWAMCGSSILLSSHTLSAHIYTHGESRPWIWRGKYVCPGLTTERRMLTAGLGAAWSCHVLQTPPSLLLCSLCSLSPAPEL